LSNGLLTLPLVFGAPLRTERLRLRILTTEDVDAVFAYQSLEAVCRYLPFAPRTREEVHEKAAAWEVVRELYVDGDHWEIAIEVDGRVVGDIFFCLRSAAGATGEIGWTLHPDQVGRGYVTEAASAVLTFGFALGLHRVMARIDARNAASAAVAERLGMRPEGLFREDAFMKGEWVDTRFYGLLAREWAPTGAGRRA
jgi:RimJ/RimL family protein N-acetyltransferase